MEDCYITKKGTKLPLLNLKGKAYLPVAYRVVWFREDHPFGKFKTECIVRSEKFIVYKAFISVQLPDGTYVELGDGIKREDYSHFADAEEKAATGAIGRALALLGYGTQFCAHELEEGDRIVDSPVGPLNIVEELDLQMRQSIEREEIKTLSKNIKLCSLCGSPLKLNKDKTWYFCPKFKDETNGKHPPIANP